MRLNSRWPFFFRGWVVVVVVVVVVVRSVRERLEQDLFWFTGEIRNRKDRRKSFLGEIFLTRLRSTFLVRNNSGGSGARCCSFGGQNLGGQNLSYE